MNQSLGFSSKRVHVDVRPGDPVLYGYDELKGKSDAELIKILESRSKRRSKGVN